MDDTSRSPGEEPELVPSDEGPLEGGTTVEFPSGRENLQEVIDFLSGVLSQVSLTERQSKDIRQAVLEMAGNAIEWGHNCDPKLLIRISYRFDPDALTFVVEDQGPGFDHAYDPLSIPREPETGRPIRRGGSGFGILLARGLVDELRYNEKGNRVTLVKRLPAAP